MEVAFRRPDRFEAVLIGEARALEQDAVAVGPARLGGEVEQREGRQVGLAAAALQHDGRPAGQRPQQLEHGDVERHRGDRQQPRAPFERHDAIHAREEVGDVAMLDHHALRPARRTGRVDQVGQVAGRALHGGQVLLGRVRHHARGIEEAGQGRAGVRHHQRGGGILEHEGDAVGRIGRVERQIGRAGLENGQDRDYQVDAAAKIEPDHRAGPRAARGQGAGQAGRPRLKLAVGQLAAAILDGDGV